MSRLLTIIFLVIVFSTNLNAQIKKLPELKSKKIIGGNGSFSITPYEDDYTKDKFKIILFEIGPEYGKFVSNNVAIGANMLYMRQIIKPIAFESYDRKFFFLSPFIKYYFSFSLYINLQAGVSFEFNKLKELDKPDDLCWIFDPGIGYAYFLNEYLSIDLKYQYRTRKYDTGIQGISSYKNHLSVIFIGIQAYIK